MKNSQSNTDQEWKLAKQHGPRMKIKNDTEKKWKNRQNTQDKNFKLAKQQTKSEKPCKTTHTKNENLANNTDQEWKTCKTPETTQTKVTEKTKPWSKTLTRSENRSLRCRLLIEAISQLKCRKQCHSRKLGHGILCFSIITTRGFNVNVEWQSSIKLIVINFKT